MGLVAAKDLDDLENYSDAKGISDYLRYFGIYPANQTLEDVQDLFLPYRYGHPTEVRCKGQQCTYILYSSWLCSSQHEPCPSSKYLERDELKLIRLVKQSGAQYYSADVALSFICIGYNVSCSDCLFQPHPDQVMRAGDVKVRPD